MRLTRKGQAEKKERRKGERKEGKREGRRDKERKKRKRETNKQTNKLGFHNNIKLLDHPNWCLDSRII